MELATTSINLSIGPSSFSAAATGVPPVALGVAVVLVGAGIGAAFFSAGSTWMATKNAAEVARLRRKFDEEANRTWKLLHPKLA